MRTLLALSLIALFQLTAAAVESPAENAAWKISMEPAGKVRANYPAPISVKVLDEKNKPVSGADVEIVLTMVEMDHGEFKTPAKMTKPGIYEGSPIFFMVGKWNVTVKAKKGDASQTKTIPYEVKE
jgi:nitrogen fixation protein FixH